MSTLTRFESLESRKLMSGDGLSAIYFDNTNFTGANGTAVTPVGSDYFENLPTGISGDFATRWAGQLSTIEGGNYVFQTPVNGGVKLWVNDKLIINKPTVQLATHTSAPIALKAYTNYHIVLEYTSPANGNDVSIALNWTRPGQSAPQSIPLDSYSSDNRDFPSNAGLFNVKSFGAVGNGIADDTAAIQAALNAGRNSAFGGIVYIPSGTYRLTTQLNYDVVGVSTAQNLVIRGQNRDNVVLKLDNNLPIFANPNTPKPFDAPRALLSYSTPKPDAQGNIGVNGNNFGLSTFDLTLDIGSGNPGASGIIFHQNNNGSLQDVSIRSSDPNYVGVYGIDLNNPQPGPGLIRNVSVQGFNYAAFSNQNYYSLTFENFSISDQKIYGVFNWNNQFFFRNFQSVNSVPAVRNNNDSSLTVVVDSEFVGGSNNVAAIDNFGSILLRNVNTAGYRALVEPFPTDNLPAYVSEFAQGAEFVGNGPFGGFNVRNGGIGPSYATKTTLDLPIVNAPVPNDDPSDLWVRVTNVPGDDTATIQAAIDFAAANNRSTIYFAPDSSNNQFYSLTNTVYIHGSVQHIIGFGATLRLANPVNDGVNFPAGKAGFDFASDLEGPVTLENFVTTFETPQNTALTNYWFEDHSPNPVVIKNFGANGNIKAYRNFAPDKQLFIEDVTAAGWEFSLGQSVWARQLNTESQFGIGTNIINDGATLWVLGLKHEYLETLLENRNGARSEILGGLVYDVSLPVPAGRPMILNSDSLLSGSFRTDWPSGNPLIRDIRNGVVTDQFGPGTFGPSAGRREIPLYSNNIIPTTVATPTCVSADSTADTSVVLTWKDNSTNETSFKVQRASGTNAFVDIATLPKNTTSYSDLGLPQGNAYTYRIVAVGAVSSSTSAVANVITRPGAPALAIGTGTTTVAATLTGTVSPGTIVNIYNRGDYAGSVTANSSGNYSFTFPTPFAAGRRYFYVTITDSAGNESAESDALSIVVVAANRAAASGVVNLTAEGTTDWSHWGKTSATSWDRRSGLSNPFISNYTVVNGGFIGNYSGNAVGYSWTNSAGPTPAASEPAFGGTGLFAFGGDSGFSFNVRSVTTPQVLKLYLGAFAATGQLRITSPKGVVYSDNYSDNGSGSTVVYTLTVPSRTALTVRWTQLGFFGGNVTLQSATLAPVPPTGARLAPPKSSGNTLSGPSSPVTDVVPPALDSASSRLFSDRPVTFGFDKLADGTSTAYRSENLELLMN